MKNMKKYLQTRIKELWIDAYMALDNMLEYGISEEIKRKFEETYYKNKFAFYELRRMLTIYDYKKNNNKYKNKENVDGVIIDGEKIMKLLPTGSKVKIIKEIESSDDSVNITIEFITPDNSLKRDEFYLCQYEIQKLIGRRAWRWKQSNWIKSWEINIMGKEIKLINQTNDISFDVIDKITGKPINIKNENNIINKKEKIDRKPTKKITKQKAINTKKKLSLK